MADANDGQVSAGLAKAKVEMDISFDFSFEPLSALARGDIDLVVTSDPQTLAGIDYEFLFSFQALLAMAPDRRLPTRAWIEPADLRRKTLITYPVERRQLNIFTHFLNPAGMRTRGNPHLRVDRDDNTACGEPPWGRGVTKLGINGIHGSW